MNLKAYENSAANIATAVRERAISPREVAEFYLQRVSSLAGKLNVFLHFDESDVRNQVSSIEKRLDANEPMRLAGIPIAIKDNISIRGVPTTCASRILQGFKPVYDAHVISKLKKEGAIIFGKTNCDEFAMGSSNENSAYGPVRNPWDLERVPGGSSGGSAAVVAADIAPLSLGSDTGGSIRQPASLCGIYGLKPTYGRVSRYGLIAYGSSLDQIGPFAQNIQDLALLYDVTAGHDPKDSTSLNEADESTFDHLINKSDATSLKGKKIGLVKEFFGEGLSDDVRKALQEAISVFTNIGAEVVELSLPHLKHSIASYYVVATAEASANLARFDGVRYGVRASGEFESLKDLYQQTRSQGFGREVKQRIMLGTFALSSGYYDAYYGKALRARALIARDFEQAFSKVDLLLSPTSPTTAFKLGEKSNDPLAMYLSDICTIGINLAGVPALSAPAGFDQQGLPIGMQLIGNWGAEKSLFEGALAYESATKWWQSRSPKLS